MKEICKLDPKVIFSLPYMDKVKRKKMELASIDRDKKI